MLNNKQFSSTYKKRVKALYISNGPYKILFVCLPAQASICYGPLNIIVLNINAIYLFILMLSFISYVFCDETSWVAVDVPLSFCNALSNIFRGRKH